VDQQVGTEISGYRIESLIGRGGMGVVYLAEDLHLKRKVALKVLAPELAQDEKFRERFVRESQLAASLDHPNIIPIFEAREAGASLYIAMRYVPGLDLKTLIAQEGPLPPERAVPILRQAASALDAAHAEGLIHRDVKPGNILITPRTESGGTDRVFLSDFGLTKRASSDSGITATGQFVGTLDYAAPEQFEGKPLDARTDVYSLGCVLYESLTGEVPFPRENQAALVYAHLMAAPPQARDKRPDLPSAIDDVISKALAKVPQDRYQSAGALVEAASDALGVQSVAVGPTTTRPVSVPPRGPGRRRSRALLVGGWAAIAAVVVLVAVLLTRGNGGRPSQAAKSIAPTGLADYVARIDPATGRVTAKIKAGKDPASVAIGEGSAWVANEGDNTVSRIDPPTGKVTTIEVGREPKAIAVGDEGVWVINLDHSVQQIDPATNRVVATVGLDLSHGDVALGEGGVWVAGQIGPFTGTLFRLDPTTARVSASANIRLTAGEEEALFVAAGAGSVWVARDVGTLFQFDPVSLKLERSIDLEKPVSDLLILGGSLWVASGGTPGTVVELDSSSGKILATIPAGGGQLGNFAPDVDAGPRLGADRTNLWVTDGENGTVSRLLTVSGQVNPPIALGTLPTGVAAGLGSVWVTVDGS
jgi:YVTN family beta-propeller protein